MREKTIEAFLKTQVELYGGECIKFVSPGRRHVPDRLVVWPGGRTHLVETKAPRKRLRPGQQRFADRMRELSAECVAVDTKHAVDEYIAVCVKVFRLAERSRKLNKGKK